MPYWHLSARRGRTQIRKPNLPGFMGGTLSKWPLIDCGTTSHLYFWRHALRRAHIPRRPVRLDRAGPAGGGRPTSAREAD
jgi:hypothetical protein